MITRMVEANYFANRDNPNSEQVEFWLREMRTARLLKEIVVRFPAEALVLAESPRQNYVTWFRNT